MTTTTTTKERIIVIWSACHRHRQAHHHNLWSATTTAQSDEDEEGVLSAFQTTPRWSASVALAGALFLSTPRIADAVTENQLVFMEAWRAVDKAYVDKTFNGVSWFKYREQTVKNTPMPSREDAYEEIKKMLKKLDDPFTRFLEPDQYAAVSENTMNANVSGIGVELTIDSDLSVKVVTPTIDAPAYWLGLNHWIRFWRLMRQMSRVCRCTKSQVVEGTARLGRLLKIEPSATPGKTKSLSVTRKQYAVVPVKSDLCKSKSDDNSVGVVKLQTFNSLSAAKTKEATHRFSRERTANSFVLDLRDDSGGLFQAR